jgi:hypothetical protein
MAQTNRRKRKRLEKEFSIRNEAFENKVAEYEKMSLDELKELYNNKKLGGSYKKALLFVTETKLQEQAIQNAIDNQKASEELIQNNEPNDNIQEAVEPKEE